MDNSLKTGFMAVFAVSGSVVFLALQAHKYLLSNFMKKMELEFNNSTGSGKHEPKKKVRFADDVVDRTSEKAYGKKHLSRPAAAVSRPSNDETLEAMPENWQVMYKGILRHRNLRAYI
ncbi:hypothetical protein BUALT_Bualt09G0105300 [Buddleja alternifolia]|uniref:Uncharacterized protein n=1 Tax=Buddleja alternifolia TaxID=168488 RepID=A0AAV6X210_9LAMI|nr:hypothetical protein BUALT_Bualt09G0105300 [Buddleja alternifolia]